MGDGGLFNLLIMLKLPDGNTCKIESTVNVTKMAIGFSMSCRFRNLFFVHIQNFHNVMKHDTKTMFKHLLTRDLSLFYLVFKLYCL